MNECMNERNSRNVYRSLFSQPLLAVADRARRMVKLLAQGIRIACSFAFTPWLFCNCEYISDLEIIQLRGIVWYYKCNEARNSNSTESARGGIINKFYS